ncbi:pseudouridine synthase [Spiroplasma diminutum]|uniref:RNA pseudouridylate synthase n=1 Tax=Spiroplasma diminutum CUAS-1 TaxID=1276221 RepID=S5M1A3_9MOLU|nr:RluA family pseudouridine synthase [Spiroplasma diminutum]AGR41817.1 ribosomal large subunit pseudouridine synthase C [Spiroplasma diminutum CUAS-1]
MTLIKVNQNDVDQTIFNFIKKNYKSTNLSIIYKWFRKGKIKINDIRVKDLKIKIKLNDEVKVFDSSQTEKRDQFIEVDFSNLSIIYEDENILIVDKEPNLEVHSPVNINLDQIVKSYLKNKKEYNPEEENSFVISHVHRIDKLTKGLVIYAKNKITLDILLKELNNKSKITKLYLAKTENSNLQTGKISGYIKYDNDNQKAKFRVEKFNNAKKVEQINRLIDETKNIYEIQIITGRKHQIRAVCNFYKAPICKDFRYGGERSSLREIDLIAYKLIFNDFEGYLSYLNGNEYKSNYNF